MATTSKGTGTIQEATQTIAVGNAALVSPQAQELLAALAAYIQPISPTSASDPSFGKGIQDGPRQIEGQRFLLALQNFMAVSVQPSSIQETGISPPSCPQTLSNENVPADTLHTASKTEIDIRVHSVPSKFPSTTQGYIQSKIFNTARKHVFNNMPIRMIAFDSEGNNSRLVDRTAVFELILQSAYKASSTQFFLNEWKYKEENGKELMIIELVERQARYAILSHTWIRDVPGDVIYRDWDVRFANERGLDKINRFCQVAATRHGVSLAWMDTVCINKDSSSELDESIRSMYKWYHGAYVCVTYLSNTESIQNMRHDTWFTRGWTLQEMLAPATSYFYSAHWIPLGSNKDKNIQIQIREATDIKSKELDLCWTGQVEKIPLSRRMELAANREVTREEDTTYSLMGILGVDMVIAYGEGSERAFFRLIRELLSSTKHILDLFNHKYYPSNKLIPSNIKHYVFRSTVFDWPENGETSLLDIWRPIEPIVITHIGIRIPLLLVPALWSMAGYLPKGKFSGTADVSVTFGEYGDAYKHKTSYSLLDKRLYTDWLKCQRPITSHLAKQRGPLALTLGVINFGADQENILLPPTCLSVPLDTGFIRPGAVSTTDNIHIVRTRDPPIFKLRSDEDRHSVRKDELHLHGLQIVTLYL